MSFYVLNLGIMFFPYKSVLGSPGTNRAWFAGAVPARFDLGGVG